MVDAKLGGDRDPGNLPGWSLCQGNKAFPVVFPAWEREIWGFLSIKPPYLPPPPRCTEWRAQPSLPPMLELEAKLEDFALKTNALAEAVKQFKGVGGWGGAGEGAKEGIQKAEIGAWSGNGVGQVWLEDPSMANAPLINKNQGFIAFIAAVGGGELQRAVLAVN